MRYALVATANYLLRVDLISKSVVPIEQNRPEYYGISWFPGNDDLVLSHSALDNQKLIDIATYAQSETGYISQGAQISKPFLSQPHQIICAPDNRIICTNTGRNVVTVIDLNKPGHYQEAGVSDSRWDRLSLELKTGDHINSVFLKDEKLFAICHRFDKGSFLATFAYPSLELISLKPLNNLTGLHNIFVTKEDQYISCHSDAGGLVDLNNGKLIWESGTGTFARGLAASDEYIFVGESQKTGRDLRHSSFSALWILERATWKVMDYICLGPFGCVHEVRLLDVPDEAHHGHIFQGLDKLLERNIYDDIANKSLNMSRNVKNHQPHWEKYSMIFGACEFQADGTKTSSQNHLCLAIENGEHRTSSDSFAFQYSMENSPDNAHVSGIFGYQGYLSDSNMNAILLQKTGDFASLSLWKHEGTEWQIVEAIQARKLPISGIMELIITEHKIKIIINQKKVLTFDPEKFNIHNYQSGYGIRWMDATVRPIKV